MTSEDIQDELTKAKHESTTPITERLIDICEMLNGRIDTLKEELLQEKRWRAKILKSIPSNDWPL